MRDSNHVNLKSEMNHVPSSPSRTFCLDLLITTLALLFEHLCLPLLLLRSELLHMVSERFHPVRWSRQPMCFIRDLASANKTDDNAGADDEGKDEAVSTIPWRCPAMSRGPSVSIVQEVESEKLHDQCRRRW